MNTLTSLVPRFDQTPRAADDVTESLTVALDSSPDATLEAVRSIDLTAPATRALLALDAADRVALFPTDLSAEGRTVHVGMIWRIDGSLPPERVDPDAFEAFDGPGHVKVRWAIRVEPSEDGAYVSIATRFSATDDRARARLLDAWGVIGMLSKTVVERAAQTLKTYAEDLVLAA